MSNLAGGDLAAITRKLPRRWPLLALYLGLSLMLTIVHATDINLDPDVAQQRHDRHASILSGSGQAPYVYRLLVPSMAEQLGRPLVGTLSDNLARELPYLGLRCLFTLGAILLFHAFLANWFALPWALCGTLLFIALHPATYHYYWYQPASALDLLLWLVAACLSLSSVSGWWLLPLVALGAWNRETIVFVPALYWALRSSQRLQQIVAQCGSMFAAWAVVFVGLRTVWVGPRPRVVEIADVLRDNWNRPDWIVYALVFFGALWILPFLRWRHLPLELKRLALILLPYLGLQLLFGRIREVRLILPLALFLIPASLLYLQHALGEERKSGRARD